MHEESVFLRGEKERRKMNVTKIRTECFSGYEALLIYELWSRLRQRERAGREAQFMYLPEDQIDTGELLYCWEC